MEKLINIGLFIVVVMFLVLGFINTAWLLCCILMQIVIGIAQLLGAIIRTAKQVRTSRLSKKIKIYWLLVILYLIGFIMMYQSMYPFPIFIGYIALSWTIALYYFFAVVLKSEK